MTKQTAKRDNNFIPASMGETDDANRDNRSLKIDPVTDRLKVNTTLTGVLDSTNSAVIQENFAQNTINNEEHYFTSDVLDLSVNSVVDIQITTPNTTKWAHFIFTLEAEAETEWYLYEGVTINTAGTTITANNNNRNSTNTSGLTLAVIENADLTDANSDTDVSGATDLAHSIIGAGNKGAGSDDADRKIILKQDTDYSIRFTANSAGYVDYSLSWYEHTNS